MKRIKNSTFCNPFRVDYHVVMLPPGVASLNPELISLIPLGSGEVSINIPKGLQTLARGRGAERRPPREMGSQKNKHPEGCARHDVSERMLIQIALIPS